MHTTSRSAWFCHTAAGSGAGGVAESIRTEPNRYPHYWCKPPGAEPHISGLRGSRVSKLPQITAISTVTPVDTA